MDTSDFKKGLKFMYENQPYVCVDYQFVKPGKGQAFTRTRMRHLLTGSVVEKNIRSGEKIELADAEDRAMQFIYPDGDGFVFMHPQSGEQVVVSGEVVGEDSELLIDGSECVITIYQGNAVAVQLPAHIIVKITQTEPGVKGDTAGSVTKPAIISSGATVQVPLFISEGEWIKIDTRTRSYLERARQPGG